MRRCPQQCTLRVDLGTCRVQFNLNKTGAADKEHVAVCFVGAFVCVVAQRAQLD
jgi:hypothetical protein